VALTPVEAATSNGRQRRLAVRCQQPRQLLLRLLPLCCSCWLAAAGGQQRRQPGSEGEWTNVSSHHRKSAPTLSHHPQRAAHCLHGGAVGAGGGRWACCGVGEVAAGPQWQGGMMVAAGVTLHCWYLGSIVVKTVLLHYTHPTCKPITPL
jgi:hypothetical protein